MNKSIFLKSCMQRNYILFGVALILLSTPALAMGFKSLMKDMKATHQHAKDLVTGEYSAQAAMVVLKAYSDETTQAIGQMSTSAEGQDMKKRFTAMLVVLSKAQSGGQLDKSSFTTVAIQVGSQCISCHDVYN